MAEHTHDPENKPTSRNPEPEPETESPKGKAKKSEK